MRKTGQTYSVENLTQSLTFTETTAAHVTWNQVSFDEPATRGVSQARSG